MTNAQARVLVLLIVLLVLESVVSPTTHALWAGALQGKLDLRPLVESKNGKLPAPAAALIAYSIGGLSLVALAAVAPDVATMFTVLLLVLVLVTHGTVFADALASVQQALGSLGVLAPGGGETSTKK